MALSKSGILALLVLVSIGYGTCHAQENPQVDKQEDAQKVRQQQLRSVLDNSCEGFTITGGTDDSVAEGKVVFRWDNRRRGSADGCTALWFDKERRPIAIASVYPIQATLHHDFDLLDRRVGAAGSADGKPFWKTPKGSKLKFSAIPKAPTPATSENARRIQLKLLAKKFSVELLGWRFDQSDKEMLRMLTTPVHRYGSKDSDVIDGGIFLFVQGVDPEAALLIEAHKHDGKYRWEYAFVAQTSAAIKGSHNKTVVWKKGRNEKVPSQGYTARPIPAKLTAR